MTVAFSLEFGPQNTVVLGSGGISLTCGSSREDVYFKWNYYRADASNEVIYDEDDEKISPKYQDRFWVDLTTGPSTITLRNNNTRISDAGTHQCNIMSSQSETLSFYAELIVLGELIVWIELEIVDRQISKNPGLKLYRKRVEYRRSY